VPRSIIDYDAIDHVAMLLATGADDVITRDDLAAATRAVVATLKARHPGQTIEFRVPPFAAAQLAASGGDGPTHRRGTPPAVVELDAVTTVRLAAGLQTWDDAVAQGRIRYSGAHASDVSAMFPL